MYYKLSNISDVDEMETVFDATFKYPDIYLKNPLINGLDEELLPIITDNNLDKIQYGIWGILPQGYKEDWSVFQKTQNTLNITSDNLKNSNKFSIQKRCVIIVSGFFLTYIHEGEIYPFYTYPKSRKPFAIAGIYNTTYDSYITCSLLLTTISDGDAKHHNISKKLPLIISAENHQKWLSDDYIEIVENNLTDYKALNFQSHPIAKEFYKNDILFETFLDPTQYESLITPF